ncbi:ArnT family glycosyltransferase [Dyadobacter psychrotolerans]|uniref:Phospholipid carrier-dependent glycosyltransferase n=1 Tax=Dyadobacter psychrotolerans TaxID=2541721 RepID=A0A4V6PFS7_9BACT|nr:glycosyltransferase family 39 protein [Dyadobacter psychrotolerans]TDE14708.1 phospholipid carrier-dependent glycosyltransferase [Dyadobacter psychrotolerans]
MNDSELLLKRYFPWLLLLGIALNIPGLWLDVMEPDGALYATIAKHMVLHNDWINLFGNGSDWLDKPHFPFWMAAISYKIFGINGFAYKLPAFLFWLLSLYYTYLTARDLFNSSVARISVLIYTVALHSTLANFDVRAEPYLTACVTAAVWHMLKVYRKEKGWHIVAAGIFIACAMMTKGIFVLITIGGGWVIFWALTKQWEQFVNYRWWLVLALSFVFILPELYSLYVQFDLHPEKVVFGQTNVSGVKFFFWDSQFGRFFNTGPIKGKGDPTFFLHTSLWAFLPWSIGLVAGVVYLIRFDKSRDPQRWIIYGSALITFLMFSMSKFQLPHYIVMEFPYFAIITGYFFYQMSVSTKLGKLVSAQSVLVYILALAISGLFYITHMENAVLGIILTVSIAIGSTLLRYKNPLQQLMYKSYASAMMLYIFLFCFFYPFLLKYQSGGEAAKLIPDEKEHLPVAAYGSFSYAFEFYSPGDVKLIRSNNELDNFIKDNPCFIYTTAAVGDSLIKSGVDAQVVGSPEFFHITRLKMGFLNHEKRTQTLQKRYLLYVNDPEYD